MQQIYLRYSDGTYNILDIERQISTAWHRTLEQALDYLPNSNRSLRKNWQNIADKSLDEVLNYLLSNRHNFTIIHINDTTPYEYW